MMKRGDTFVPIADADHCAVCGADAETVHLCAECAHEDAWHDRFVYEYSEAERAEMAPKIANQMGVSLSVALEEYMPDSTDYFYEVRALMSAISELMDDPSISESGCGAEGREDWESYWTNVAKLSPLSPGPICNLCQINSNLLSLTTLEDKVLGRGAGETMRGLIESWGTSLTKSRVAKIKSAAKGMSIDTIVQSKIGSPA